MALVPRFFQPPTGHFFLFGPRGTGKTSLLRALFPDALRVDLLLPDVSRQMAARPERLRDLVAGNPGAEQVVIDEVQKVPELLEVVHALIEEVSGVQFVLTGSSARKLRRSGVNLLGGRAAWKSLHPFMAAELGAQFNVNDVLRMGMLPLVRGAANAVDTLNAYAGLYVREEVQFEGLIRNVGSFARFLEAISFSQASVLNIAGVARECQVSRKTVEGFLRILEDLLLSYRIPVFARRAQRELAAHPKFFLFDVGVYRTLRPAGPLDRPSEIDGIALESLVAQHLKAWCDYSAGHHELHYWRTRSNVEVDFVVYGEREFHGIEVKNTLTVRPEDLRGLTAFGTDFPESRRWLLYRGGDRFERNGVTCINCASFLQAFKPDTFPR